MRYVLLVVLSVCMLFGDDTSRLMDLLDKRDKQKNIERELDALDEPTRPQDDTTSKIHGKLYYFRAIKFANLDQEKDIDEITEQYIKRKITASDIYELIEKITNFFISKGYTTTIATIKEINEKRQVLILEIKYGYVDKIILNNKQSSIKGILAIPIDSGDRFNIFDIDQGLENLNNTTHEHKVTVQASDKIGYSNIIIDSVPKSKGLLFSLDNSASNSDGPFRATVFYDKTNLLGINDTLSFIGINRFTKNDEHIENLYSIKYSIPIRYILLRYSAQRSYSSVPIQTYLNNITQESTSIKHMLSLEWTLMRTQTSKVNSTIGMNIRDNNDRISNIVLASSTGRYTNAFLSFSYYNKFIGGAFFTSLKYQRGLTIFGAKKQDPDSLYDLNYNKFDIDMLLSKYLYNNEILGLLYTMNFAASYSKTSLLYADKFLVGDEYTVRGFKDSSAAWDLGMYVNNTLSLKLFNVCQYCDFEPFFGADIGYGRDYLLTKADLLMGISTGLKYFYKNFYTTLSLSYAIHRGYDMPKEKIIVYFSGTITI